MGKWHSVSFNQRVHVHEYAAFVQGDNFNGTAWNHVCVE